MYWIFSKYVFNSILCWYFVVLYFYARPWCATIFMFFIWGSECKHFIECILPIENYICPLLSYAVWNTVGIVVFWPLCTIDQKHICLGIQAHVYILYALCMQKEFVVWNFTWDNPGVSLVDIMAWIHFRSLYFPYRSVNITHKAWMIMSPCQSIGVTTQHQIKFGIIYSRCHGMCENIYLPIISNFVG
jgi:hypothetical protein